MSENEKYEIHEAVLRLEDAFWILNYLKPLNGERYKRIHEAIKVLQEEHDTLYKLIKED